MARWQQSIRDKLFVLLLTVLALSIVGLAVTALLPFTSIVARWGPVVWASVAVLGLTCVALYAWHRKVQDANARTRVGTYSFAEAVVRMRARERVPALSSQSAARRSMPVGHISEGLQGQLGAIVNAPPNGGVGWPG
jgi:hypothetical protein